MAENDTLLANLVSRFPGNTENIATEALSHILTNSDASIEALNDVVRSGVGDVKLKPIVGVSTQVINDRNIPDLVGFDDAKAERVIVEVKFWANLTNSQPNGYLKRLPDDGPAVLMFLAPEERIKSLWPELRHRIEQAGETLTEVDAERKCMRVGNGQKYLMLVSWTGLLDSMAARTRDFRESGIETDIRQLRNLAKYADNGAFKPISRGEEFGADPERRRREYQRLIEAATEIGVEQGWASRKGLRATSRTYGFGRYVKLHQVVVWFGINEEQFEKTSATTSATTLWVEIVWDGIPSEHRDKRGEIRDQFRLSDDWIPVNLKNEVEYQAVLDGVVDSLKHIADTINAIIYPPA